MTNSINASISKPPPGFKNDNIFPENYLTNVVIFFLILATLGFVVSKFLKRKYPSLFKHKVANDAKSIIRYSQRLSPTTKIYFLEYQEVTVIVTESTDKIYAQSLLLPENRGQTKLSCEAVDLIKNSGLK